MEWKIKKYKELSVDEIYSILKIRNEVFIVEQNCPYEDCDGKDKDSFHLFLEDKGEMISYLRIIKKGISYDRVSIGRVLVNKSYREKGIAKEMMLKAINFIEEELNECEIKISAQVYLINFYKTLGFKEISNEYLEDNIPHINMIYIKGLY